MKTAPFRLAPTLGILLIASCAPPPPYQRPEVTAAPGWMAVGENAGLWPDPEWWKAFGSDELNALMAEAIANSRDLRAAVFRIREAEAEVRVQGAAQWPSLSAAAQATREPHSGGKSSDKPSGNISNTFAVGFLAAYQVDLFGHNQATAAAAVARLEASTYDRETVAITLESDVASTYFQIISLRDRQRVATESLQNAQRVLEVLATRTRAGGASDLETAQQQSIVATQQAALPVLILAERQSTNALAVLLGRNPEGFAVVGQTLADMRVPPVVAGLPSELLRRRPDIRKAEAGLRAASFDTAASYSARLPSIQLTGQGGVASHALSALFGVHSLLYSLAASITAPIFAGGQLEGQQEHDAARFAELAEDYQKSAVSAFRDVEDALSANELNGQQADLRRRAYERAQEALRLAEIRYRAGAIDFMPVLDAQRLVFDASSAYEQVELTRYTAISDLYKALGGGWEGGGPPPEKGS